jgi:RNA polymerase sigma factor (sigma-70 family)
MHTDIAPTPSATRRLVPAPTRTPRAATRSPARARHAAPPPVGAGNDAAADALLVQRCLRGEGAAWKALVSRYQRLVHAIVGRIGLDEHAAADVFQTVFARLFEQLARIDDPTRLQAWIVTTAKREALLQRKRAMRTVSMTRCDDDEDGEGAEWDMTDGAPIAEELLSELQQHHRVRAALDRLDERSRALLLLLFRDDDEALSYEEIARRMQLPVGSLGPMRARCIEKLRRQLR